MSRANQLFAGPMTVGSPWVAVSFQFEVQQKCSGCIGLLIWFSRRAKLPFTAGLVAEDGTVWFGT